MEPFATAGDALRVRVVPAQHSHWLRQLTFGTIWAQAAGAVASVVAPSDCRVCSGPLLRARRFAVCDTCLALLRTETAMLCGRCGERLEIEDVAGAGFSRQTEAMCEACTADAPAFVRATAFAAYDSALRVMIRLHKFEGMRELAEPLGAKLATVLREVACEQADTVHVIAVPLFGRRRPYNQSADIANAAVRELRRSREAHRFVVNHPAMRRIRKTDSQSHLSPAQRRGNVRGAFAVCSDVTGWTVALVDDVYTTGATAAECTRMLLNAGAEAVHVVTLARTQPERVARWQGAGAWDAPASPGSETGKWKRANHDE